MEKTKLKEDIPYIDILDNLDIAVAVFDSKGNYLFVNRALVNWRNIPRSEFEKMNVHEFLPVISNCVFDLVMQEKKKVSCVQTYQDIQKVDSEKRMRMTTGMPIFDENGNIKYVINAMQDIDAFEAKYHRLLKENKVMDLEKSSAKAPEKKDIIAKSPKFLDVLAIAENTAPLDSTILLYGESGCGKEVVADYIYRHSKRAEKPIITVNCAAFPENLIEAELFGYEKGAFTGANREGKMGLIEAADGGTLFLDEINSLSMNIQGKLLRILEDKSIQRIGSTKMKKVDFRLIAATNRDLRTLVADGSFREDLYYRLQVIPLTIPPIRERVEDIVPLCLHFMNYYSEKYNIPKKLSDGALEELKRYDWPGNVREIRNFAERVVVMTPRTVYEINSISPGLLSHAERKTEPVCSVPSVQPVSSTNFRPQLTKEQVLDALERTGGHRGRAAEYLGVSRRHLQYKIKEFHISDRCRYAETEES